MASIPKRLKSFANDKFGTTVMGERGQVVIPRDIREAMGLKAGDQLVTIFHDGKLFLMNAEEMKHFMDMMSERFASVAKVLSKKKS